jgi:hypothetical protein
MQADDAEKSFTPLWPFFIAAAIFGSVIWMAIDSPVDPPVMEKGVVKECSPRKARTSWNCLVSVNDTSPVLFYCSSRHFPNDEFVVEQQTRRFSGLLTYKAKC